MNPDSNNESLVYKATGFAIFIVLVGLIILMTTTSDSSEGSVITPQSTTTESASESVDPIDSEKSVTSESASDSIAKPPETTEPAVTTAKPPETAKPPVNQPPAEAPKSFANDTIKAYIAKYPDTVLSETDDAGQEYIDRIIFLGDSTTYGLKAYKMLTDGKSTKQVWTPTNGTLTLSAANTALIYYPDTGKEITIKDAVAAKKPEIMVITLGVNGVSFMGEDYFKKEYGKLIDSIKKASPDTKIILQSIFPVAKTYQLLDDINNEKIDTANKWICELADKNGVKYLDTNSVLRDSEGWLPENYHNGDGMHLKENSFKIELDNIRTHAHPDA